MDVATEQLFFTLWGTSDGRQGSYTLSVVDKMDSLWTSKKY